MAKNRPEALSFTPYAPLRWLSDDTLNCVYRDLLTNGIFDDSDDGLLTTAALRAVEYEAGVRALSKSVKL